MPDDTSLLQALQAGDSSAFSTLFETYADRLYRLAMGLVQQPDEAEDVVQETFIKAITHLDQFEGRSNLGTWLYRVAYNASLDRLRQRVNDPLPDDGPYEEDETQLPMPELLVEWHTPEDLVINEQDRLFLDQSIRQLPQTLRTVFVLRDIDELSTAETAEILGLSISAVKVRLHRARLELRETLAAYFTERLPDHRN
jgi:RNA polymerase sigma-70 factor, ECF subfamily